MVTSSSSIFPEIIRRLSGVLPIPRNAQIAAPAAAKMMTMIRIRFFIDTSFRKPGTDGTFSSFSGGLNLCGDTAAAIRPVRFHSFRQIGKEPENVPSVPGFPFAGAFLRSETPSQPSLHALAHRAHRLRQVDPA